MNARSPLARDQLLKPRLPESAAIKLIGLGGVGSIVARYLFTFLASLGQSARFVLIDGDSFEFGNTGRMIFGSCGNKAAVIRDELFARVTDSPLSVESIEEFITPENVAHLIHNGDIVLLTVDNHVTRKLVDNHCASLDQCCLISGGNDGIGKDASGRVRRGTFGNVQIYVRENRIDLTPSLSCHHPEIANPADVLPTDKSCHELAMSVPQILFVNLTVAAAILNTLFLHLSGALHYGELAFDIAEGKMRPVMLPSEIPQIAQNRAR